MRHSLCIALIAWVAPLAANADAVTGNQVATSTIDRNANRTEVVETKTASGTVQLLQDLAPLPVLALGLLGLIWIRKHTADL